MKRYLFILCAALFAGFLSSCTLDDEAPDNGGIKGEKTFTLKYTVEGRGSGITTYTTVNPEAGEDVVQSLYLMFFEPSNNNSGEYIETI
ncbi:MAG: hypothetical protein LBB62_01250, partial [Proteiniphilum sp.]|nr:hypothetical protein [Proteiniphilum sp.]